MRSIALLACLLPWVVAACSDDGPIAFGDDPASSGGAPAQGGSSGASGSTPDSGAPPVPPHCGDPGVALCADGAACRTAADCTSLVCAGTCTPASPTDHLKNGTETDVDCGGLAAPACAVGKACAVDADCTSAACPSSGVCRSSRSCRRHFGGETCGAGEVDDPAAQHEDCCLSIQPDQQPYQVDKYLITAGRMRAFAEEVSAAYGGEPNIRQWVADHLPEWDHDYDTSLPSGSGDIVRLIGTGNDPGAGWGNEGQANGCYVGSGGAPTYWHSKEALETQAGDIERAFTQDQLDTKILNCTPAALLAAFCIYDGGYLTKPEEWTYAVRGAQPEAEHLFPWGNPQGNGTDAVNAEIATHASYNKNYQCPPPPPQEVPLASDGLPLDRAFEVSSPGRFPLGAGPYGHMDLLGGVETMLGLGTWKMVRQYAFQEGYYGVQAYGTLIGLKSTTSHYAVGARCSRPLPE